MAKSNEYDSYVPHPRYGQGPRLTGLNPEPNYEYGEQFVYLHWHSRDCRVPNTAIVADTSKQHITTMRVTHYFDVKRTCSGCRKPFLFFAEEQKYWYEELGFSLEANCDRCVPCRKKEQGIARQRQRYEELQHVVDPSADELLEMAECCLALIEASLFTVKKLERVRMCLNRLADVPRHEKRRGELLDRVRRLET
jgi:hypothetical protein